MIQCVGFVEPAKRGEQVSECACTGRAGRAAPGPRRWRKLGFRGRQVEVRGNVNPAECVMRFAEIRIEDERGPRLVACLRVSLVDVFGRQDKRRAERAPGAREQSVRQRVLGIGADCFFEISQRPALIGFGEARQEILALQQCIVGRQVHVRRRRIGTRLRTEQLELQLLDDRGRNLRLDRKDVLELAIVRLRPQFVAVRGLDQIDDDAHAIALLAHAALEQVHYMSRSPIVRLSSLLFLKWNDELRPIVFRSNLAEDGDQFLRQAVGKYSLAGSPLVLASGSTAMDFVDCNRGGCRLGFADRYSWHLPHRIARSRRNAPHAATDRQQPQDQQFRSLTRCAPRSRGTTRERAR
jgi:hypothetical protein